MSELNLDILKELGSFTRQLRKDVSLIIKEGLDIFEIIDFIESRIFENGYLPSFPAMVSVNDMAAHYTVFDEGYKLKSGDVIKVDFGASKDGYMTDNAFTVEITTSDHTALIETAKACLDAAMEVVSYGTSMAEVGDVVEKVAEKNGFNTIHNLSGHQIGRYNLHCGLSVPNLNNGDTSEVKGEMQLAIEPFITYGQPLIKDFRLSNILHLKGDKPVRDPIAMKVLRHIREHFPKQPFSKRWLWDETLKDNLNGHPWFKGFSKRRVEYAVSVLKKYNVLYEYDELGTIDGKIVAQFEDCVLFKDDTKTILTRLRD
jgi:methionyl aminopeptidase